MSNDESIIVELIGGPLDGSNFSIGGDALKFCRTHPRFPEPGGGFAISFYSKHGVEYWYEIAEPFAYYRSNVQDIGKENNK